jgi:hypothetical protein
MATAPLAGRQFVAICGASAVGKGTLIRRLRDEPALRKRFGIDGGILKAFDAHFELLDLVRATSADIIVWKWQFASHRFVDDLRLRFPSPDVHRAIWLWRPWEEHAADFAKKYRNDSDSVVQNISNVKGAWTDLRQLWYRDRKRGGLLQPLEPEIVNAAADYAVLAERPE